MALFDVKVPQLSESIAEATLLQWKKKPGDMVAVDEILIEIETDKVVLEVPAPSAGVLAEIMQADCSTVTSGQVIAKIQTDDATVAFKERTTSETPLGDLLTRQVQANIWL